MSIMGSEGVSQTTKARKDTMLCVQCGSKLDREGITCQRCTDMNNISKNIIIQKLHADHQCTTCKNPMDRVGWLCTACLQKLNDRATVRTAFRRSLHLCTQCGVKITDNKSMCRKCLDELKVRRGYPTK